MRILIIDKNYLAICTGLNLQLRLSRNKNYRVDRGEPGFEWVKCAYKPTSPFEVSAARGTAPGPVTAACPTWPGPSSTAQKPAPAQPRARPGGGGRTPGNCPPADS